MSVSISIHVDGYYGLTEGVTNLLDLFKKENIRATFFVNMGREASIIDILKNFRKNKKEFKKSRILIRRYNKLQMLKIILFMRKLGSGHKEILKKIENKGHKVGPHCWNHLEWSKNFDNMNYKKQILLMKNSFKKCLGRNPGSFAPPLWKINHKIITELEKEGFKEVCVLKKDVKLFESFKKIKPHILTFNNTIEELLQEGKSEEEILRIYEKEMKKRDAHVYFHADYEGRRGINTLKKVLSLSKK